MTDAEAFVAMGIGFVLMILAHGFGLFGDPQTGPAATPPPAPLVLWRPL